MGGISCAGSRQGTYDKTLHLNLAPGFPCRVTVELIDVVKHPEEASPPKTKSINIDINSNKNSLMMLSLTGIFKEVFVSPKSRRAKYSAGED